MKLALEGVVVEHRKLGQSHQILVVIELTSPLTGTPLEALNEPQLFHRQTLQFVCSAEQAKTMMPADSIVRWTAKEG